MGFKNFINSKKIAALLALILGGTQLLMAQTADATAAAASTTTEVDTAAMWTGVAYYSLLFLLVCIGVAIVGRILKVYDLSNQLQGKKATNWNTVMGILFILFLLAGLYGSYWSFTVQGTMSLPEAASKHGVKIDEMFTVTFIITVIVFFITQIALFGFAFAYKGSDKRRA